MLNSLKKHFLPISIVLSTSLLTACGSDDKNTAPELIGETKPIVAENTVFVSQYSATDAENDTITLALDDAGSALFTIDQSGALSFINAPDFDEGDVGPFAVTIVATDEHELSTELNVSVTVGDVKDTPSTAVVQTVAPDYTVSEVNYITPKTEQVDTGYYIKDASDYTLSIYKNDVYHIGRYFIDEITKYDATEEAERDTAVWSFSTQDAQDPMTRNPYALVSVDENKAYLIRNLSSKVWIVNPQATTSEDFKIGELDLSGYAVATNSNETPNPASAVITDGKLYIAMQRFDDNYTAGTAYIAVFDIATDTEIETNANDEDSVKGIPLSGINPLTDSLIAYEDKVLVTTRNDYSSSDLSLSRIEEINTGDYSVREVLNARDIADNLGGFIESSVVVSAEKGYFYASETSYVPSYAVISTLYEFNPTTGEIITTGVADTGTESISFIGLDAANFLWVSVANPELPGVDVINTETNTKYIDRLPTVLNPGTIRFIEE